MEGSSWRTLLAAIVLIQLIQYGYAQWSVAPMDGEPESYDWTLPDNETEVAYTRNFPISGIFAYATLDQSKKSVVIEVVPTSGTSFRGKRCEFNFDIPENSKVVIDHLNLRGDNEAYRVGFVWHVEGNEKDLHVAVVDRKSCRSAEGPNGSSKSSDGNEEAKAPAANGAQEDDLEIPKDYHFIGKKNNADKSTAQIYYVNETSATVSLASTMKGLPQSYVAMGESLDMDKYGVCWLENRRMNCSQGARSSGDSPNEIRNWTSWKHPSRDGWLGVINYADSRMLILAVGPCFSDRCNSISYLSYGDTTGDVGALGYLDLRACANNGADVSMDAFYDVSNNRSCFNAVCVAEGQVKLRRQCIKVYPFSFPKHGSLTFSGVHSIDTPVWDSNDTDIIYSTGNRTSNVIAFTARHPANLTAVITVQSSNSTSTFKKRKCEFDFDAPEDSSIVMDSMRMFSDGDVFRVSFTWHVKGQDQNLHHDALDSITCDHAIYHRNLKKKGGKSGRAEESKTSANEEEAEIAARLTKLETPEGYHFVDEVNSDDSTVHIKHVNVTSSVIRHAAEIKLPLASGLRRDSLDMDAYGVCWTRDKMVTCARGPKEAKDDQHELTIWATLRLGFRPDFLGVHNWDDDRMLVLVGRCSKSTKECGYFELYEVRAKAEIYRHTTDDIQLGVCENQSKIKVTGITEPGRVHVCFQAVCVDGSTFKLRRMCAKRN